MYEFLKNILLEILKCPKAPPEPPGGSYESVQVFRAAPSYLKYRLLRLYIGLLVVALGELFGVFVLITTGMMWGFLLAGAIAVVAISKVVVFYVGTRLDYEMRFYLITDRSLRIREGVWVVREMTLTFANIQNMKIEQGPIQRFFKIYDLVVETAGGGGAVSPDDPNKSDMMHQGVFRGIGRPEELRDLILRYLRTTKTSGLGDRDDAIPAPLGQPGPEALARGSAPLPGISAPPFFGPRELEALRAIAEEIASWREEARGCS